MRNTLYLYRDRFGVKPLYYTKTGDTLVFASRIDTLFEYPRVRPCIDMNSFNEIFSLGPAKRTAKVYSPGSKRSARRISDLLAAVYDIPAILPD